MGPESLYRPDNVRENIDDAKDLDMVVEKLREKVNQLVEIKRQQDGKQKRIHISRRELAPIRDELAAAYPQWSEMITAMAESFSPSPEWFILTTHLLNSYKTRPDILKKFWGFVNSNSRLTIENKLGVMAHAGAYQLLETLGYNPRLPTPEQDSWQETDLFVDDVPVQVKSATNLRPEEKAPAITVHLNDLPVGININVRFLDKLTAMPNPELLERAQRLFSQYVFTIKNQRNSHAYRQRIQRT